jgi:hypothetical protein
MCARAMVGMGFAGNLQPQIYVDIRGMVRVGGGGSASTVWGGVSRYFCLVWCKIFVDVAVWPDAYCVHG